MAMSGEASGQSDKPYPYGACQEITLDVLARLQWMVSQPPRCAGARALRAFLAAGGEARCIWGILRGAYFQTAIQLGSLYVDVANDTVVATKPKVEILPMAESGLEAVRDAFHFAGIAESYWGMKLYGNHAFPALAPVVPMIGVTADGSVSLQSATGYMIGLFARDEFRSAGSWLASAPPPPAAALAVLRERASPTLLAANPVTGQVAALASCRSAREHGLAQDREWMEQHLRECQRLHAQKPTPQVSEQQDQLARHPPQTRESASMSSVTIDGRTFDLDMLSEQARAQLASIQFVDGEIVRLQAQLAAMQTARSAYGEALRRELPQP